MPKDALVDNLIGMCATRCGHCTPCVAAQRLVAFDVRCEALTALEQEKAEKDRLHAVKLSDAVAVFNDDRARYAEELDKMGARCETLAAERDRETELRRTAEAHARDLAAALLEKPYADEYATLEARCQHLEQAMRNLPQRTMNIRGDVDPDWTLTEKRIYRLGHRDARHKAADLLTAALASLLPSPGWDGDRR